MGRLLRERIRKERYEMESVGWTFVGIVSPDRIGTQSGMPSMDYEFKTAYDAHGKKLKGLKALYVFP